jgi:triacylglycerol lipase
MNFITDIHQVNIKKLNILMTASLQAYAAFDDSCPATCQKDAIKPPENFDCVCCWSGIDSLFTEDKTEEIFGVVFRSQKAPYTYIFAFRGTASILDALDDLGAEHRSFKPYDSRVSVSSEVKAEAGFYDIYTEQTATVKPMQQQLFELLDEFQQSDKPIGELWITGHSLGSSLSTLFSLDVGLSRPEIRATNMNFACPRTGNQAFVDLFEQTLKPHNTLRVQNTYDAVPCVPFEDLGYAHTPWALLVAFYEEGLLDHDNLLARHSALNYQTVIQCAEQSPNGYCVNYHLTDQNNKDQLIAVQPSSQNLCDFFTAQTKTD